MSCSLCGHGPEKGTDLVPECSCASNPYRYHPRCIDTMRRTRSSQTVNKCPYCFEVYPIMAKEVKTGLVRPKRFLLYVARDFSFFTACILLLWYINRLLAETLDDWYCPVTMEEQRRSNCLVRMRFFPTDWASSTVYWICGAILLLAEAGFIGLVHSCIKCCAEDERRPRASNDNVYIHHTCCLDGGGCHHDCGSSSSGGGDGAPLILLACLFIFALFGIFYAIFGVLYVIHYIVQRHVDKLYVQAIVEEYPFAVVVGKETLFV